MVTDSAAPRWAAGRWAAHLLTVVLGIAVAVALSQVVRFWWHAVAFAYPLDYGEGPLLDQALRLSRGEPIYGIPGTDPPWTIGNYPPLYPALNAVITGVVGPAYWYGRLLSVIATVAAAAFAGSIVAVVGRDRVAGVITAGLMPVVPYLGYWSGLARIDTVALVLSLAGLWCVVRRPRATGWLVAGLVLLIAAGSTRQTYLLTAPATAVCWLWSYGRRRALLFAAGLAGGVLVLGLSLDLVTGGGFWFDVVTANVNAWDLDTAVGFGRALARQLWLLVVLAAVGVVVAAVRRSASLRLLLPYAAGSLVVAMTIGKIGSNVNYLLELGTTLCLAWGLLLAGLQGRPWARSVVLLGLVLQVTLVVLRPYGVYGWAEQRMTEVAVQQQLAAVVAETRGPVLADEDLGLLPLADRRVELQPFELTQLAAGGSWDQQPLLDAIADRRFGAILIYRTGGGLAETRWTPEMLSAIETSYLVEATIDRAGGQTLVYRPPPA